MAKVAEKLKTFLEENPEFTQTRIAATIGVSVSALNAWMKGTYKGDNERLEKAVSRFLEAQKEAGEETGRFKKDFDFVETKVYHEIKKTVNLAEYRGEIRTITGRSGIGKTVAINQMKKERENMILVKCYPAIRKNRFLKKLCQAAGFDSFGTFDDMFEDLCSRLEGTGRPIAIDEAEHLTIDSVDIVRRIHDFTGCGVVFVGLPKFYDALSRRQHDYAYVYNRTSLPTKLRKNTAEDLTMMASTMIQADIPGSVLLNACKGVGRDLKIILLESLRVAADSGINNSDVVAFSAVIDTITKKLGRKIA